MYSSLTFLIVFLPCFRVPERKKGPALRRVRGPNASAGAVVGTERDRKLAVRTDVSQGPNVQESVGGVLDLKRRVVEPEPLVEDHLEVPSDAVTVLVAPDEHVRRERREPGRDLPDVQVVHARDAGVGAERSADLVRRAALGRRLED